MKTNEELKAEIELMKKDNIEKRENKVLEKELQDLKDDTDPKKKLLKSTGKFFLGVGKAMNNFAKNQANKKR